MHLYNLWMKVEITQERQDLNETHLLLIHACVAGLNIKYTFWPVFTQRSDIARQYHNTNVANKSFGNVVKLKHLVTILRDLKLH